MNQKTTPNYWKKRILEAEAKAHKTATAYAAQEKAYYSKALKEIENAVNALFAQMQSEGADTITRTQLWQFKRWQDLRNIIYKQCQGIGINQVSLIDTCLEDVFNEIIGSPIGADSGFTGIDKDFTKTYLNENWSGTHYSNRVWSNSGNLAASLEKKIEDLVILGKTPDELKKELIKEFGASYSAANRLIRTEASYTFNQGTLQRYAAMGVNKVEVLTENGACEACKELENKEYSLNDAPFIPVHPNCRCCYIPVIEN